LSLLIRNKYWRELGFGFFVFLVVFFTDDVLWYHLQGMRLIDAPLQPDLFLFYFSFTYGIIEFSYVTVMFREEESILPKIRWTILLYSGWLISAFTSQLIPLDDRIISISRDMSGSRLTQILMVAIGYLALLGLKYSWEPMKHLSYKRVLYLFLVGFILHLGMELTLHLSGIRPIEGSISIILFNSLLEFNSGVPFLYIAWSYFNYKNIESAETFSNVVEE
ncbi:MAG: hypothetical protein ACTSQE_08490, partial [Candidatus Heimdallarchaeaceae archaeon]